MLPHRHVRHLLIGCIMIFLAGIVFVPAAESAVAQATQPPSAEGGVRGVPSIVERGPHDRMWQWTEAETNEFGTELVATNSFTEVATGLHFRGDNGAWQETVAAFEVVGDGFVAARGLHQVALANDLSVAGAVTLVTPEGQTLRSTPTLLAFVDRSTGESVRIGDLKASRGELVEPNIVLYPDAFDTVAADVRAVYTAAGFECDVVLRRQLPDPAAFGMNPDTTELAVYTEFLDTQPDSAESRPFPSHEGGADAEDVRLTFGSMVMDRGRAFGLYGDRGEVLVRKTWDTVDGRTFLIEQTAYRLLQPLLSDLPEAAAPSPGGRRASDRIRHTARLSIPVRSGVAAAWPRTPGGRLTAPGSTTRAGQVALHRPLKVPGVVLDYSVVNSTANQIFDSLTTYYVSGGVFLTGTATFQPGTVIKYANTNSATLSVLSGTTLNWLGAPYRPVVLTARDDNSIGEPLPGATGIPVGTYASVALNLDGAGLTSGTTLSNLCVRHAAVGLYGAYYGYGTSGALTVRHAQFVNCGGALSLQVGSTTSSSYFVENALIVATNPGVAFKNLYYARVTGEFLTVDGGTALRQSTFSPDYSTVAITNSLVVGVGTTNGVTFSNSTILASSSSGGPVFLTAGAGAHYLNLGNASVTDVWADLANVSSPLFEELDVATVNPPSLLPALITANQLLLPSSDHSGSVFYLGYHYWIIDYVANQVAVTNATLTLSNLVSPGVTSGTVLAAAGTHGLQLRSGGRFVSQGRPDALNRLCWASAVQELPTGGSTGSLRSLVDVAANTAVWPEVRCRLTRAEFTADAPERRALLTVDGQRIGAAEFANCQFRGAYLKLAPGAGTTPVPVTFWNNVWAQCSVTCHRYYDADLRVDLRHNLFSQGGLNLYRTTFASNPTWTATDNLFDAVTLSLAGLYITGDYNGYTSASAAFGGTHNQPNLVPVWATGGTLGPWYYPTTGGATTLYALVNAGSQSAASAGLYHYTTRVDQTREPLVPSGAQVDIGFHYVATAGSASSIPRNTDLSDQLPDYLEDANGDGLVGGGESSWTSADADGDQIFDWMELLGGTSPTSADSDGDAHSDLEEYWDGVSPLDPFQSYPQRLGEWRFDQASLTNEQGVVPLMATGVVRQTLHNGSALRLAAGTTTVLRYPL
ncbi:MAG: hypothetical protein RIS76_1919, partial [Verrucomicrobiota bacterium]